MPQDLPERFQNLFRAQYPTVLRKLLHLVGDKSIAEDLAQEVFLRLYRKPPDDLGAIGAWLHRVATRVAYDYIRQKIQQQKIEERQFAIGMTDVSEPAIDLVVLQRQEREAVKQVLQQLSDRDRQVLLLRYSGYSYAEIAEVIGVNPDIVGTIIRRALARFKVRYRREEGPSNGGDISEEGQASWQV